MTVWPWPQRFGLPLRKRLTIEEPIRVKEPKAMPCSISHYSRHDEKPISNLRLDERLGRKVSKTNYNWEAGGSLWEGLDVYRC